MTKGADGPLELVRLVRINLRHRKEMIGCEKISSATARVSATGPQHRHPPHLLQSVKDHPGCTTTAVAAVLDHEGSRTALEKAAGGRLDLFQIADNSALRELEAPAGFPLAEFLALDDVRVAGQKPFFFENGA